jgi:hypothetical protein
MTPHIPTCQRESCQEAPSATRYQRRSRLRRECASIGLYGLAWHSSLCYSVGYCSVLSVPGGRPPLMIGTTDAPEHFRQMQTSGIMATPATLLRLTSTGKLRLLRRSRRTPTASNQRICISLRPLPQTSSYNLSPCILKTSMVTGNLTCLWLWGDSLQIPFYNNGTSFQGQPPSH